ncbi:hypothetical protein GBAR_LOCUS13241, partial [Geodia barretti]
LSLPIQPALLYHTSAVFASALETATLFYRTHHNLTTLPLLTDSLTAAGRKICSLGVSLLLLPVFHFLPPHGNPWPISQLALSLSLWPFQTPQNRLVQDPKNDTLSLATSLRGTPPNYHSNGISFATKLCLPLPIIHAIFGKLCATVQLAVLHPEAPPTCHTPTLFPRILSTSDIMTVRQKHQYVGPVSRLQTQSSTKHLLLSLLSLVNPRHTRQFPAYAETCLDHDNTAELVQNVSSLADCYSVGGPPSDEDSD